ncbi:MAG: hypothetical protein DMG10_22280 [Acidobacteria bacterium]|nr:MAG: hypothetical protein DMG10_22280 [Acidobacteriota bacterium]
MKHWVGVIAFLFGAVGPVYSYQSVDYLRDVKPVFASNCYGCHGAKVQMAGLRLDTGAAILKGSMSGPVVVPGSSAESKLIRAVTGAEGAVRMPFKKPPLKEEEIARIKAWVDQGAKVSEAELADDGRAVQTHWAFLPPVRPALPEVHNPQWVRNEIDRFVLARLEKEGIAPSPEADRVTLIRRLSLDLLGLPPSIEEVDAFLADKRPDAYERLLDRVLQSPHYGERWGRHWLDLARYADSNGYSIDAPREIWKYRDWVIDALNRDVPFDQFVIEQMAGDTLPNATVEQKIATGFHRNTPFNQEGGIDLEQFRIDYVADRVNTIGAVFLGLTVGCARCHDHKYDPISQREYFQLFAFLNNADEPTLDLAGPEEIARRDAIRPQLRLLENELQDYAAKWVKNLSDDRRRQVRPEIFTILALSPDQRDERQKQILGEFLKTQDTGLRERLITIEELKKREPKFPSTLVLQERAEARETYIHLGGDFTRKGSRVSPGVPGVLHPLSSKTPLNRLDLARWLVDPKNPLLARVTVNRMWQHYFGKGLVETENDFGTQGTPPTHPELLDWLATEFVARGWSQKAIHRLIVTSAAYRQSSRHRPDLEERDPYNRLLARQSRVRLDAEIIRDSGLTACGLLNRKIGGPSVFPPQPEGVFGFTQIPRVWIASQGPERYRRGMYTYFWRSAAHPLLMAFDAPDAVTACTRRNRSTTPMQALTLLNDQAFLEMAQGLAARVLAKKPDGDEARIGFAFRLCLAREPSAGEAERLLRFLRLQSEEFRAAPEEARALVPAGIATGPGASHFAAWTAVARVLLNLDEFITRE